MTEPLSLNALVRLGKQARLKNAGLQVTGVLFYDEGRFIQVLEGDRSVISMLFARIAADPRHNDILKVADGRIRSRLFEDWSMRLFDMDDLASSEATVLEHALATVSPLSSEAVTDLRRALAFAGSDRSEPDG